MGDIIRTVANVKNMMHEDCGRERPSGLVSVLIQMDGEAFVDLLCHDSSGRPSLTIVKRKLDE
jgi:hypothetical protein